jgi:hypothetical protein
MKTMTLVCGLAALGGCVGDPVYIAPENQTVSDFVSTGNLKEVSEIRKTDRDSWKYVNDHYIVYHARFYQAGPGYFLVQFTGNCDSLNDNSVMPPPDYIHDHRNIRATDTIRGCIVDKMYEVSDTQRKELRSLGEAPGQRQLQ